MTGKRVQRQDQPVPTDEELAALVVALEAYLAERRAAQSPPVEGMRRWALAGRLASGIRPWGVGRVPWRVEGKW